MLKSKQNYFSVRTVIFTAKLFCMVASLWLVGLFLFIANIPEEHVDTGAQTDAIVILTGGSLRLEEGFGALTAYPSTKVLVSGVAEGVTTKDLIHHLKASGNFKPRDVDITLGNIATSTITNAYETKIFVELHHLRSLRLVTSSYHMPRTKLLFSYILPEVQVVYHPVYSHNFHKDRHYISTKSFWMVCTEYNKYLGTLLFIANDMSVRYLGH